MSVDIRCSERKRYMDELQGSEKDIAAGLLNNRVSQSTSTKALQETEKRIRREIANSNERRRMQCINAGFSNLRASIPLSEGEKLSKAAILQHATEYIASMEKDKTRLQIQLDRMKRMLLELGQDRAVAESFLACVPPPSKRKKRDTESSDEGVGSLSDASDDGGSDQQQENTSLRHQLEAERLRCATLEERNSLLETQLRTVLQVPTQPLSASVDEVRVMSYDYLQKVPHYNRDVAEGVTLREPRTTTPQVSSDSFQHPKSMSPAVERIASSVSLDTAVLKNPPEPSSQHELTSEDVTSPAVKVENLPLKLTTVSSLILNEGSSERATPPSNSPAPAAIATTTPDQQRYHSHSYNHRDHPRRRHRQQAQLEQQRLEEELRNQQEQIEITASALSSFRPKHNTQNLHNLVEAIRQIEGDRVLDGEQKFSDDDDYKVSSEDQESKICVVGDYDRHSQSRDSPSLHHHLQRHQSVITSQQAGPKSGISSSGSSYLDKYPIAAHLLHRPIHPSFYRPGVIVHKL